MKFGVRLPGAGPYAGPDVIATFARKAEDLGFDSLWMPNHILLPVEIGSKYPYREDGKFLWDPETPYLDTLLALTWAAAATSRIQVGTSALVTAWHHPVNTAKALATLDVLNGGRTVVAVATGWMREQFDILGAKFEQRGARWGEYIELLRHLWTADLIDFHGRFFDYAGFKFYPKPVRKPSIPLWVAGTSEAALRRAARLGDGWHPLKITPGEMREKLGRLHQLLEEEDRDPEALTISVRPLAPITAADVEQFAEMGVSLVIADPSFDHPTIEGVLAELEEFAGQFIGQTERR